MLKQLLLALPAVGVIEEDEEAPVQEPASLLQLLQRRCVGILYTALQLAEETQRAVPVDEQDLISQTTPKTKQNAAIKPLGKSKPSRWIHDSIRKNKLANRSTAGIGQLRTVQRHFVPGICGADTPNSYLRHLRIPWYRIPG